MIGRRNISAFRAGVWAVCVAGASFEALGQNESFPIDFELYADARLAFASGEPSWFNDWLGKGRYGGAADGSSRTYARISEVSLLAKADITWDLQSFAHLKYDPEQDRAVDIVEAYLKYQPAPKSAFSYSVRAGLFFPHISRENVGVAWTTPYSITPSAINSWVGEEVRALGLEGTITYRGELNSVSVTGAVFGFNDPAGTLLAFRGWGIGDAKVGAFGELPLARLPSIGPESNFVKQPFWVRPVREIDNRPGFYGAVDWKYGDNIEVGAFYYDNRGDPEAIENNQYAWDTKFWNFYVEADLPAETKLISQYMTGNTKMGRVWRYGLRYLDVDYDAGFILASKEIDRFRITGRFDWFSTDDNSFETYDDNNENGTSFMAAVSFKAFDEDTILFEYLRIDSKRPAREAIGFSSDQANDILQLSYRKRF